MLSLSSQGPDFSALLCLLCYASKPQPVHGLVSAEKTDVFGKGTNRKGTKNEEEEQCCSSVCLMLQTK
jgi:hypothetical protein